MTSTARPTPTLVPDCRVRIVRRYHATTGTVTHALDMTPRAGLGPTLATVTARIDVEGIHHDVAEINLSVEQTLAVAANMILSLGEDFEPLVREIVKYHNAVAEGTL